MAKKEQKSLENLLIQIWAILSAIIIIALFWYIHHQSKQYFSSQNEIFKITEEYQETLNDNTYLDNKYIKYKLQAQLMSELGVKTTFLNGTGARKGRITAIVCNDTKNKNLYVFLNTIHPPDGKGSFVLWARQGNHFSNLGTINYVAATKGFVLQKADYAQKSDGFLLGIGNGKASKPDSLTIVAKGE